MQNERIPAIAICGATATGKSGIAMRMAEHFPIEIICMDSMQIYIGLDIGTAKPTKADQAAIEHHMLDIVSPDAAYTVADYVRDSSAVIESVYKRGHIPLLVGGTGLYLRALMHDMALGGVQADSAIRDRLHAILLEADGAQQLHRRLEAVDPASAARLHPNDTRRVIRALEVYEQTGKPIGSQITEEQPGRFHILPIAIDMPREKLYARIEQRVHQMVHEGLLTEAEKLYRSVPADAQSMQAIGYKEWVPYLNGACPMDDAVHTIILNTRHFAKRQFTFQRREPDTVWLPDTANLVDEVRTRMEQFWESESK